MNIFSKKMPCISFQNVLNHCMNAKNMESSQWHVITESSICDTVETLIDMSSSLSLKSHACYSLIQLKCCNVT